MRNIILQGDALAVLKTLPDELVQTVMTSPPYFGLRDYNLPPTIWDGDEACQHEWGEVLRTPWANEVPGPNGKQKNTAAGHWRPKETGPFCQKCGAVKCCLGLEPTPGLFIQHLVQIFREVRRVLRKDGTCWVNMGDSFAGSWGNYAPGGIKGTQRPKTEEGKRWERKAYGDTTFLPPNARSSSIGFKDKDLMMMPARLAIALQEDGWWLRQDNIWYKPNAMCESVEDRPSSTHEHVFLLTKSARYFYDADAIREPLKPKTLTTYGTKHRPQGNDTLGLVKSDNWGRTVDERQPRLAADGSMAGANKRNVWTIATQSFSAADLGFTDVDHFATFPPKLAEIPILAGTSPRACEHCGSPWERVTERIQFGKAPSDTRYTDEKMQATRFSGSRQAYRAMGLEGPPAPKTVGWQPTCKCKNEGTGKCVVLDPFMGSGTVAMVALEHHRDYLGIELNPSYIAMAEKRIATFQPNLWETAVVLLDALGELGAREVQDTTREEQEAYARVMDTLFPYEGEDEEAAI